MTRVLLLLLLAGACGRFAGPRNDEINASTPVDAAVDDDEDEDEKRNHKICEERCDMVVNSRHDVCGPGHRSWPAWCAESNRRMYDDCAVECR